MILKGIQLDFKRSFLKELKQTHSEKGNGYSSRCRVILILKLMNSNSKNFCSPIFYENSTIFTFDSETLQVSFTNLKSYKDGLFLTFAFPFLIFTLLPSLQLKLSFSLNFPSLIFASVLWIRLYFCTLFNLPQMCRFIVKLYFLSSAYLLTLCKLFVLIVIIVRNISINSFYYDFCLLKFSIYAKISDSHAQMC